MGNPGQSPIMGFSPCGTGPDKPGACPGHPERGSARAEGGRTSRGACPGHPGSSSCSHARSRALARRGKEGRTLFSQALPSGSRLNRYVRLPYVTAGIRPWWASSPVPVWRRSFTRDPEARRGCGGAGACEGTVCGDRSAPLRVAAKRASSPALRYCRHAALAGRLGHRPPAPIMGVSKSAGGSPHTPPVGDGAADVSTQGQRTKATAIGVHPHGGDRLPVQAGGRRAAIPHR